LNHHSDWEGVVVAVDESNPLTFSWASFDAHGNAFRYAREQLRCDGSMLAGSCGSLIGAQFGQRVNVYVANGTHASYSYPCDRDSLGTFGLCLQRKKRKVLFARFPLPERQFDGRAQWARNDDQDVLRPLTAGWVGWRGHWDPTRHVKSPGGQPRFGHPETNRGADCPKKICARTVPLGYAAVCGGWFGQGAAVTACNARQARVGEEAGKVKIRRRSRDGVFGAIGRSPVAGVAQLAGSPLEPGEQAVISGAAPAGTELYARATVPGGPIVEARFPELGLEAKREGEVRAAFLNVSEGDAGPVLRLLLPSGETAVPVQQVPIG
jgi:hypothetical protein